MTRHTKGQWASCDNVGKLKIYSFVHLFCYVYVGRFFFFSYFFFFSFCVPIPFVSSEDGPQDFTKLQPGPSAIRTLYMHVLSLFILLDPCSPPLESTRCCTCQRPPPSPLPDHPPRLPHIGRPRTPSPKSQPAHPTFQSPSPYTHAPPTPC